MLDPTPIAAKVSRARKHKLSAAIVAAAELGVRWRWSGTEMVWHGLDTLSPSDRVLLEELQPEIEQRLADPAEADPERVLDALDIEAELITDPARAAEVIAELPATVGADTETMARPEHAGQPNWLAVTADGRRGQRQPKPKDKTALDPHRACPRLLQVYDPKRKTSFVFDWSALDRHLIRQILDRKVLVHNALFDLQMLMAQGVEPAETVDTVQLSALLLGGYGRASWGQNGVQVAGLKYVAEEVLGLDLSKDLQTSDWSAPSLSDAQLAYAAADAAIAYRCGCAMWRQLGEREHQAYRLANAAVPVIARMALRGLPFDRATHARTIATWQHEYAEERAKFRQQTGEEVPVGAPAIRAWLKAHLSQEAQDEWPKTETGLLKTGADEVKRLAQDWPAVLPLLAVQQKEKRLSTFGTALLDEVSVVTGRLHGSYSLPTITGRLSCRSPNLQQLPADCRAAIRGKVLLAADYGQIELRILAELAGEEVMRAAFAAGKDIHMVTAARFVPEVESLPGTEQKLPRNKAKAVNYGLPYGMGTDTLRRKAWKDYWLDLTRDEVELIRNTWFDTYPAVRPYQREQYSHRYDAVWSVAGRPRRACWEPEDENGERALWYTDCCNFAVQGSASDLLLDAMERVDRALPDTLVASVHDELLLELDENRAERAASIMAEEMLAAFVRWFPDAPTAGVVNVKIINSWDEAK